MTDVVVFQFPGSESATLVSWPGLSTQEELVERGAVATKFSPFGGVYDGAPSSIDLIVARKAGVQDEGSQLVAKIFADVAKDQKTWLDLCAGPGGKAALLSAIAKNEDIVLIAGKGHEKYQEINGVRNDFDDKRILSEIFELMEK